MRRILEPGSDGHAASGFPRLIMEEPVQLFLGVAGDRRLEPADHGFGRMGASEAEIAAMLVERLN